jgi:hypothetical protein
LHLVLYECENYSCFEGRTQIEATNEDSYVIVVIIIVVVIAITLKLGFGHFAMLQP